MIPRFVSISITLLVISNCAGLASTGMMSSSSPGEAAISDMATPHKIEGGFQVIDPSALQIQPKDLQAGQQVRLVAFASTPEMKAGGSIDMAEYVGTIDAIDADNIVLKDASRVTSAKIVRANPIASRVPYFGRMFKSSGTWNETHPLPHGVTIPRSKVIVALGADTVIVKEVRKDRPMVITVVKSLDRHLMTRGDAN